MRMVQSLTELGKILLPYSRKKDFQYWSRLCRCYLVTKKYFPFWKANNAPLHINGFSNHPPTIIKQLPKMINKRISDLSYNKEEFDKVRSVYESTIKDSRHFPSMSCDNRNTQNARGNRNRKVMWFNLSYSQNVKTNIVKLLIKLVSKHFHKSNKYHNSNLKLSYCCITNVGNIIN